MTTNDLAQKECVPCKGDTPPLTGSALANLLKKLCNNWKIVDEHHLEKEFTFADFKSALAFTNKIGELAETQNHHPDIYLSWGLVRVVIFTHKIEGLTETDFIFAAKIENLKQEKL